MTVIDRERLQKFGGGTLPLNRSIIAALDEIDRLRQELEAERGKFRLADGLFREACNLRKDELAKAREDSRRLEVVRADVRSARMILGMALGPKLAGMEPVGKKEWEEIAERVYGILGRNDAIDAGRKITGDLK